MQKSVCARASNGFLKSGAVCLMCSFLRLRYHNISSYVNTICATIFKILAAGRSEIFFSGLPTLMCGCGRGAVYVN